MTPREAAVIGWKHEIENEHSRQWMLGNHEWTSPWEAHAAHDNLRLGYISNFSTVLIAKGGAKLEVGNVGAEAIVIVAGGGAEIIVNGDVAYGAKILAAGGGAKVTVYGSVHETAQVLAHGGGAEVIYGG